MMTFTTVLPSPVGYLRLFSDGEALTGLQIMGTDAPALSAVVPSLPLFARVSVWLDAYFSGERPSVDFSLRPSGTDFQRRVWRLLADIPYGESVTYRALADILADERGGRMSAQAVGHAVGQNPIAILIPCHRVLGRGGLLVGYRYGLTVKETLLTLEGIPYRV